MSKVPHHPRRLQRTLLTARDVRFSLRKRCKKQRRKGPASSLSRGAYTTCTYCADSSSCCILTACLFYATAPASSTTIQASRILSLFASLAVPRTHANVPPPQAVARSFAARPARMLQRNSGAFTRLRCCRRRPLNTRLAPSALSSQRQSRRRRVRQRRRTLATWYREWPCSHVPSSSALTFGASSFGDPFWCAMFGTIGRGFQADAHSQVPRLGISIL